MALGEGERAQALTAQAETLKELFNRAFWCDALSTYAIALDRDKKPCAIKASNAGHCLFTGIATMDYARRVAKTLLSESSFSGWGIRTLDMGEVRYNPMAYHNGSVWPHDNALIAAGLARYGCNEDIHQIMSGLFDASLFFDLQRLPELFCGFGRRTGEGPTLYPVACSPQAWAAGAVFLLLQTCLGLSIQADQSTVCLTSPSLPEFVAEVHIDNLRVGSGTVALVMDRASHGIGVERRVGEATIVLRCAELSLLAHAPLKERGRSAAHHSAGLEDWSWSRRPVVNDARIDLQIIAGHARHAETLVEDLAAAPAVKILHIVERGQRLINVVDDKAGDTVVYQFRNRAAAERNHRRAAGHGFNHYQTERFRPVDRKNQRIGVTQKILLTPVIDFTDTLDQRIVEQGFYVLVKVLAIGGVNLRGDFKFHAGAFGDLDGAINAFFRRNSPDEGEIIAAPGSSRQQILGKPWYTVPCQLTHGKGSR